MDTPIDIISGRDPQRRQFVDCLGEFWAKEKAGSGNAGEMIGFMDDKVKRALEPLDKCINRIEKENPEQFS